MVNSKTVISGAKRHRSANTTVMSESSTNHEMRRMLIRPLIGAGLSLLYGKYFDNRIFLNPNELMRAGIMGGAILASDKAGNMLLPHLMLTKHQGYREIESMIVEPLLTGLIYTGAKYYLVDENSDDMMYAMLKGTMIDVSAGVGEV
jgi:hypothetical protein